MVRKIRERKGWGERKVVNSTIIVHVPNKLEDIFRDCYGGQQRD